MPKMPGGRDNPAARFAGSGRPANPLNQVQTRECTLRMPAA